MNLIKIIMYLFVSNSNNLKDRFGYDERFSLTEDKTLIKNIVENYQKKELLEYLQSNKTNIIDKLNKIQIFYGNNPKQVNLSSGGLLDDWNFEI